MVRSISSGLGKNIYRMVNLINIEDFTLIKNKYLYFGPISLASSIILVDAMFLAVQLIGIV